MSSVEVDYGLLYWAAASFTVGSFFYWNYHEKANLVNQLQSMPRYVPDQKLYDDVSRNNNFISYAAITGNAQADDKHLYGLRRTSMQGLISHNYVVEHTEELHEPSNKWYKEKRSISNQWSFVPFSLCRSGSKIRVSVQKPLEADELNLTTVYDKYRPSEATAADKVVDFLFSNKHVVGVQSIEKMLLPNAQLTAIGQVVLHDGHIRIEPSDQGLRYYLTSDSIESLVRSEESVGFIVKVVAGVFLGIGGVLCGKWLYDYYKSYQEELEYRRLELENNTNIGEDKCVICLVKPKNIVLIPCGHVCACKKCLEQLDKCPMCRRPIERKIPIFL